MLIHTGDKLHDCDVCGKSFTQKSNLTQHMLIHTGDKQHICGTCGTSFTQKNSLTQHMLIHTGDEQHICGTCGKSFRNKSNLKQHILIHTAVKHVENHLLVNRILQDICLFTREINHTDVKLVACR